MENILSFDKFNANESAVPTPAPTTEDRKAVLESKKEEILAQVQEMIELGIIEEGFLGFGKKSPEELKKAGLEAIMKHPSKKKAYQSFDPEKQAKYAEFVGANPGVNSIKWAEKQGKFVDATIYTAAAGPTSASGHLG